MASIPTAKKRDLSALREQIADVEPGDQVRVHLRDKDRYGDFVVSGEVYRSLSGELCLCGFPIVDAKGKPGPMLVSFDPDVPDPMGRLGARVEHGQIVRIMVNNAGRTKGGSIIGRALAGERDDLVLVAGFILGGRRVTGALVTDEIDPSVLKRTPATEIE